MVTVWLVIGWIAGCLTTTGALLVWSLIIDSREMTEL